MILDKHKGPSIALGPLQVILDKHKGAFLSSGASLQMVLDKEPEPPLALGPSTNDLR